MSIKCSRNILIIGNHPISHDITSQYENAGRMVTCCDSLDSELDINTFDELCVLADYNADALNADNICIRQLSQLALRYNIAKHDEEKMRCHLLLRSNATLRLVRTVGFDKDIERCFEIYAFTLEDQWAKLVLCGLGAAKYQYPRLDRQAISFDSDKTVRLVLTGLTDMAEYLAINAALVAHYPNYNRNNHLRTRITMIDKKIDERIDAFIGRYQHLFENSYYRMVKFHDGVPSVHTHVPMYEGHRKDFVDVEWEFVAADVHNHTIRRKLEAWTSNVNIELSIALCNDEATNINDAFDLPDAIYENRIPVLLYVGDDSLVRLAKADKRFGNILPFGMPDSGYDVTQPLLKMAKMLHYFYSCGHDIPLEMQHDKVEEEWAKLESIVNRYSNMFNVMTIPTKMHTMGHDGKEWNEYYALTQNEIETLSEVEHNRWCVERLISGWRPCTNDEKREIHDNISEIIAARKAGLPLPNDLKKFYKNNRRVHYDLRAYDELDVDATGGNVKYYDYALTACIPLIAKSFSDKLNCHEY